MSNQKTILDNNAFKGKKPFKFVLSHASLNDLTLTHAPDGWKDNELKLERSKTYHGVIKSVSTKELIFYKEGRDFLQKAYEMDGVNCEVTLTITRYNYTSMKYEAYHTGVIDFTTYTINEVGVTVELASDSFWDKITTRDTQEVNLRSTTSVEGLTVTPFNLNTITIPDTNVNNAANFTETSSGFVTYINHTIPCTVGTSNYNETQTQTLSTNIEDRDYAFFKESEVNRIINVKGSFDVEFTDPGSGPFACEFVLKTLDTDNTVLLETSLGSISASTPATIIFDKNITLYAGQSCILEGKGLTPLTDKFEYSSLDFDVTETVVGTVETECKGFLVYEAFLRCLQLITDSDNPFYSLYFGRTDTPFTTYASDGELIALIKGMYFRYEWSTEPITVKLRDLFESLFSIYSLSLNHEVIGDVDKVRVESLAYAYDDEVVLDISDKLRSQDIEKSVYPDLIYSKITIGYNKYTYEQTGGLWEYNGKSIWSTVIRALKNDFTKISKYRADYNGIKLQIDTTDVNEDAKGDDDNFFVTTKRDGSDFVALLDDNFSYVGGTFYAAKSLNLDITPARNLRRLNDFVKGSLLKELNSYIRWQASDKPSQLETQLTTETSKVDEDADIRVDDLTDPLWIPEVYNVEVPLTYTEITQVLANPKGMIKLSEEKYGWILSMQTKNWDGMTQMELLRVNLDRTEPYPIEGAIRFVKDGDGYIDASLMVMTGPKTVIIDWGDGVVETVLTASFSHSVEDGAIVIIYGLVETFTMASTAKISHISAVKHASLTELTVSDNNLTGADFDRSAVLQKLNLPINSLETITLTGCTGLTNLSLRDNTTFTENVDISECTSLQEYSNYRCSQTTIDLSTCPNLTSLLCWSNSITAIDITTNTKLTLIRTRVNPITALDTTNNSLATEIDSRVCDLTSFDVSGNPLVTTLILDYNNLPVADINSILVDLDGFGLSNGYVNLSQQTPAAPPSGTGSTAKANLIAKGWTVTTD